AEHLMALQELYHRVIQAPRTMALDAAPRWPQVPAAADAPEAHRGRARLETFLEQAPADLVERLEAQPEVEAKLLDLFGHSAYFADQLLRFPELLEEIGEPFQLEGGAMEDPAALRRFYRRQMLRIQS